MENKSDLLQELIIGIKNLPEYERIILTLIYYEHLSISEISKLLNKQADEVIIFRDKAFLRLKKDLFSKKNNYGTN